MSCNQAAFQNDVTKEGGGGQEAMIKRLDAFTIDNRGKAETTNFGTKVQNADSLKAGPRGPTLMEDFAMREKIMHFDHERIPERVVHARGVGAHGYFEPYKDWSDLTAAKFLRTPGKRTPVFVRFSTVLGSRGSPDTVRDVRGFATRFYTEEGLFDLVGNVIGPFFVHDAIKFPDLIHSGKPQPDKEVPQAGTAHETAYDFFAEFPESIHTVMWALSGRGLPRSFRQVDGFGVHTFRLINEQGKSVFVKFHWKPMLGLANLVWDEAQKIAGKDIDFHRRDLYTAIERGDYPEYELGVQVVAEEDEHKFDFDLLDPTKIIPESLVPVTPLGKMVLNRNVTNFFAETEQVTFCVGNVVRGIGFTNDSLLQGRLFSYLDTQLNRMNSANFHQLPINRPLNGVHNNQRDGFMQMTIHRNQAAYYPNKLDDNYPRVVSAKDGAYMDYAEDMQGRKVRQQVPSVDDHYSQAQLYWNSLTEAEKQQTVEGFRFEVGKSKGKDVRARFINVLNHVDNNLARRVAVGVGVEPPAKIVDNLGKKSVGLSIEERPRPNHIHTKTVAILTAPGTNTDDAKAMFDFLKKEGAYVEYVGMALGEHDGLDITHTYLTTSSVLWDAVFVPDGKEGIAKLMDKQSVFPYEEPMVFVLEAFRHGKPIAASGAGVELLRTAQLELPGGTEWKEGALSGTAASVLKTAQVDLPTGVHERNGVLVASDASSLTEAFKKAIIQQRFWSRLPIDPPV